MQVKILPLAKRFIFNDIIIFHKIFNNLMPVQMPDFLSLFSGITRLQSSHLDRLSYESSVLDLEEIVQMPLIDIFSTVPICSGNKGNQKP